MAIIFMGKTGSGKSTIAKEINSKYGHDMAITYTTRPMRKGEIDGKDYHFISESKFEEKIKNGDFVEYVSYNTVHGKWYYGSDKEVYKNNNLIILNPLALKQINNTLSNPFIVYLKLPEEEIMKRLEKRGDNMAEVKRRIEADRRDFANIEEYATVTIDATKSIDSIVEEIMREYTRHLNKQKNSIEMQTKNRNLEIEKSI